MRKIIVGHVKHPPQGYELIRCDRASVLGNPYTFMHEDFRDRSIAACRQWLWENIKFAEEHRHDPMIEELIGMTAIAPQKVESLVISSVFKKPSVLQVIQELERIAKTANTKGDVALLCWCRGYPNPKTDKACHCDVIKKCIENLFLFKYIPVVAQEAGELISNLKKDLTLVVPVKPIEPVDLSDLLSKIDVECDRLHTTSKQEAIARFGRSRQALNESELREWLHELKEIPSHTLKEGIQAIAVPTPQPTISPENLPLLAEISALRTQLGFDKGDVVHFYNGKIGKTPNFGSSTELKVLIGLLEVEIGDRAARSSE